MVVVVIVVVVVVVAAEAVTDAAVNSADGLLQT